MSATTTTPKMSASELVMSRFERRHGYMRNIADGVAAARGTRGFSIAIHRDAAYSGDDVKVERMLEATSKATGALVYRSVRSSKATELARELAAIPADASDRHTAPVEIDGITYNAKLVIEALRILGGTVRLRVVELGVAKRGNRPLILEREGADVQVVVMPLARREGYAYPVLETSSPTVAI